MRLINIHFLLYAAMITYMDKPVGHSGATEGIEAG